MKAALQEAFPEYDVVEFTGFGNTVDQLDTFATASMVVGAHGAGLSNLLVSPQHTPVLELGPVDCQPCYVELIIKV